MSEKSNNVPADFLCISFAESEKPTYKEKRGDGYIEFGNKNDYPLYLNMLYSDSAKHNAIVGGKVKYISGNGFVLEDENDVKGLAFLENPNTKETLNDILPKVSTDIEVFGGSYIEVIWGKASNMIAEIYHIDYSKYRTNADNTQFWFKEDWFDRKEYPKVYNAFNPNNPIGKQVLFLKEYRPNLNAYPLPNYFGALDYIEADIQIGRHILGNAKTGFTPSKLITLPNGEVLPEKKSEIKRQFEKTYTGSEGLKFMLSFVQDASRRTLVDDLGQSDITREDFTNVDKIIQQNIFAGHQIPSPDLFGISTPGQLGSRQQMRDAYEIFKNTYVNDKQRFIESAFNLLAKSFGVTTELKIQPVEPIGMDFSEATIKEVAPKAWILEKLGIDASKYEQPVQMKAKFNTDEEVLALFAEYGESKEYYTHLHSKQAFSTDDESFYLEFIEGKLSQLEANILALITKDNLITPEILADTLNEDLDNVNRALAVLERDKIIAPIKDNKRKVLKPLSEVEAPKPRNIVVRYSYEWKPSIPSSQRDTASHPSREFCKRLMAQDKYYTRADIESISARLGYSVFDRRGGWWTMPNGNASPSCRHLWQANTLIKK
jgi:hypothetical protein